MIKAASRAQKLLLITLVGLLLLAAAFAGRYFLADIYYHQAKRYISKAEASPQPEQRLASLETGLAFTNKAIALNHHTDYLNLKASSLLWQSSLMPEKAKALQEEAERLYRNTLQQRPSSAHLWLGLAESLLLQGRINAEFSHAIKQVSRLGFHEGLIQRRLLSITMPSYDVFSKDDQTLVQDVYAAALKAQYSNRELIRLGQESGLLLWFCTMHVDLDEYPKSLQRACEQLVKV